MDLDESPASRKRRPARERKARWKARPTQESIEETRAKNNESHRKRLKTMS